MSYGLKYGPNVTTVGAGNTMVISGISSATATIAVKFVERPVDDGKEWYFCDLRTSSDPESGFSAGGGYFFFQPTKTSVSASGISNIQVDGVPISTSNLYNTITNDSVVSFVASTISDGAVSIGARYNKRSTMALLFISEIVITDSAGTHTIDLNRTTGTSFLSDDSALTVTLVNFPGDDSQWVFYGAGGVSISASVLSKKPLVTASASASVPAVDASVSALANKPYVSVSAQASIPQPDLSLSVLAKKPAVIISASASLPQPDASIAAISKKPEVSISVSSTSTLPVASISMTANKPSVSLDSSASLPQPQAVLNATAKKQIVSAVVYPSIPSWIASLTVDTKRPIVSIAASQTLPQPLISIGVSAKRSIISVAATQSGIQIKSLPDARISIESASNSVSLQAQDNSINIS